MTKSEERDWECTQMAIISAEYDEAKAEARASGRPHQINYAAIEKRHNLEAGSLKTWRANHLSPCRGKRKT
jgi:hypothetical protein